MPANNIDVTPPKFKESTGVSNGDRHVTPDAQQGAVLPRPDGQGTDHLRELHRAATAAAYRIPYLDPSQRLTLLFLVHRSDPDAPDGRLPDGTPVALASVAELTRLCGAHGGQMVADLRACYLIENHRRANLGAELAISINHEDLIEDGSAKS